MQCLYEIPCHTCNKTYIGETGRAFITRKTEHQKECEKETKKRLTEEPRSQKELLFVDYKLLDDHFSVKKNIQFFAHEGRSSRPDHLTV